MDRMFDRGYRMTVIGNVQDVRRLVHPAPFEDPVGQDQVVHVMTVGLAEEDLSVPGEGQSPRVAVVGDDLLDGAAVRSEPEDAMPDVAEIGSLCIFHMA